jgi:hypothetical protein
VRGAPPRTFHVNEIAPYSASRVRNGARAGSDLAVLVVALAGDGLASRLGHAPDVPARPAADIQHIVGTRGDLGFRGAAGLTRRRRERVPTPLVLDGTRRQLARGHWGTLRDCVGKLNYITAEQRGTALGESQGQGVSPRPSTSGGVRYFDQREHVIARIPNTPVRMRVRAQAFHHLPVE